MLQDLSRFFNVFGPAPESDRQRPGGDAPSKAAAPQAAEATVPAGFQYILMGCDLHRQATAKALQMRSTSRSSWRLQACWL